MLKILRKNQKFVMVLFAVVLMVMFVAQLGQNGSGSQSSPVLRQVATLNGAKVTQRQLNVLKNEWDTLKSLQYVQSNQPDAQPRPLLTAFLIPQLVNQIEQSYKDSKTPPLFFLLSQEAQLQGISVSDEELQTIVNSNVQPNGEPGSDERLAVEDSVRDLLLVSKLANRIDSVIKISKPYQEYTLANMEQDLTVAVETLHASSFLKDVPNPTDAEIAAQFDKYKDRVAAVTDRIPSEFGQADDPLGFGYKTPNRVTLQYIGIRAADVKQQAIASKSQTDWYVAAFGEFKANRSDYDSKPVPTTQGSSPSTEVKTLPDLEKDFELHAPIVLNKLYGEQFQSLTQDILKEINERLSSGFGTYRDAVASAGGSDSNLTGDAAAYVNFKFMHDLADSIQAKFNVTPVIGDIRQFKSESQLSELAGIGITQVPSANMPVGFPYYAVRLFQPWMSDTDKSSPVSALAISLWQPSTPVADAQGDAYVFRISGSDVSHIPALSDVKDQVAVDCRLAAGYAKALQQGQQLLSSANALGLDAAAAQAKPKLPLPIITDQFNPQDIIAGRADAVINPLIMSSDSARQFAKISQQLLTTAPTRQGHRQLLAELYADRTVAVVELREAQPSWDEQTKPFLSAGITQSLEYDQKIPLELAVFKPDAVASRLNYQTMSK
jgi:hypothetical protein